MGPLDYSDRSFSRFVESPSRVSKRSLNISLVVGILLTPLVLGQFLLWRALLELKQTKLFLVNFLLFVVAIVVVALIAFYLSFNIGYWLLFLIIYVGGWILMDEVFRGYERIARDRIKEIEASGQESFDYFVEQGLLLLRVFNDKSRAIELFRRALTFDVGSSQLVDLCVQTLTKYKEKQLANEFSTGVTPMPQPRQRPTISPVS